MEAQAAEQSASYTEWATEFSTQMLGWDVPVRPLVAIPAFIVALFLTAVLLEWIVFGILRRLANRTDSPVDDAIVAALRGVVNPAIVMVALHVSAQTFLDGESQLFATRAILSLAIAVIAFCVARGLLGVVDAWVSTRKDLLPLGPPLQLAIKIALVPLVLLTILDVLDVPIVSMLTTLGVGSLAVALALQETLANVFAGVQLVLDQPIRAGDFIEIDANNRGTVHEIGLRSTKIRTLSNNMIIVPNSLLASTIVTNNDTFERAYAHRFTVGVGYGSDSRHVERVLLEVCEEASSEDPGLIPGPPKVVFLEFGESALIFRVEIRLHQYPGRRGVLNPLYHRIHERFRAEGIEIPFPMRNIVMRDDLKVPITAEA